MAADRVGVGGEEQGWLGLDEGKVLNGNKINQNKNVAKQMVKFLCTHRSCS